jgi:hypothetical protein
MRCFRRKLEQPDNTSQSCLDGPESEACASYWDTYQVPEYAPFDVAPRVDPDTGTSYIPGVSFLADATLQVAFADVDDVQLTIEQLTFAKEQLALERDAEDASIATLREYWRLQVVQHGPTMRAEATRTFKRLQRDRERIKAEIDQEMLALDQGIAAAEAFKARGCR